ncbi:glutathione synthetase, variant 1 [Aphanomyces astaci]|uniref:Glutathione synthetase n=2 Tax=Aphanomyces astaci TaxID=112090 RepID=W4FHG3_APHAT|nr:glutathione synthetase, variant 1 [Aphanomyces astaci]ETV66900.1 glutathione synthetase, variant 1 [Aphanomyces astaci]|eukprot:XP_009843541.1 glutathione synthetase, variant 1 [Aphanomyces astaci]
MADLLASIASSSSPPPAPTSVHADKLGLTASQVSHFLSEATAYAAGHGMLVQAPEQRYAHLPYCLLPVPFPRQQFELGIVLSPIFALLVDRVAADPDWLHEQLQNVLAEDAFTRRLVELSKAVQKEGVVQTAALGIHRSDYMLHDDPSNATSPQILQVELNTIAASFACMSSLASDLHRFLLERYEAQIPSAYYGNVGDLATHLPRNPALHALPAALARAHSHYGRPSAVIVFVVQPNESNSVDQRWLEYTLWTAHKVKVFRRSLHQLATAEVRGATRELWVDGVEVAVAYFRAGYTPTDYPSETEWIGRTLVERSLAIKCPNIAYHLAGTKKVQQVLATPSELRRFLTEDQSVLVEKSFTGLFGLEQASPDLPRIKALVAANPTGYVLKPQREGGGNNLYGEEVVEALATLTPAELESFILMERILPQEQPAVLVRNGAPVSGDTISELGMFSVALFDNGKAILNEHAGHLLRTKLSTTNEGGVAAGFAVLSSPFLV